MSYADTRDSEQLRFLETPITEFIWRYQSKSPNPKRRTLFLFPGGMGCQLFRAKKLYKDSGGPGQKFHYDKVWLTLDTFLGDALKLKMHKDGDGVYRDLNNRIIIANGSVEIFGLTPYDRFTAWCELNNLDWFIFGWDWRRRLDETVSFFLNQFLPKFRSTVQAKTHCDPLADFILMGHSFGGMIVDLILRQNNPLLAQMTRAVTVASPFYGYDGQIHRWFEGESYFNWLGTMNVIKVITSFPGCYTLPYLDMATYLTNQAALANDPEFPLLAYPSQLDPFNLVPNQYPGNTGFMLAELQYALNIYQTIAAPLTQYADRFFNIRGVQIGDTTVGSIDWKLLTGSFDPSSSPISNGPNVPGDGIQPAWSTRLVTLPSSHWVNVRGDIDHMFMMEYDLTQQAIADVL
jgi:hypothetical protein